MSEEPEAYQIGNIPFLGLTIYLDSRPLIPRVETEYWVEKLVHGLSGNLLFLDLCAGSGAIGCSVLKHCSHAHVYFGEIDPDHAQTIQKNIGANNLDGTRAEIHIGDLFAPFKGMQFDVIAANPPYIPDHRELPPSVTDFEPSLALRAGPDGLLIIRRIAKELKTYLKPQGQAWIECDIHNIEEAKKLFETEGFRTNIVPDQYKRPRVLVVSFS